MKGWQMILSDGGVLKVGIFGGLTVGIEIINGGFEIEIEETKDASDKSFLRTSLFASSCFGFNLQEEQDFIQKSQEFRSSRGGVFMKEFSVNEKASKL
jgi:hypothetical protein